MCITPINLTVNGFNEEVACRNCWQCRSNRVNDLVGRCIAEQEYSSKTYAVTLTYGGDNPNSSALVYEDIQNFMKRLRKRYKVRFIVAGEYGSKKGRAHWHAILFFQGEAPKEVDALDERNEWDIRLPRWQGDHAARIDWYPWPHGYSYFQQPDYGGFQYILKYVLKDYEQETQVGHLGMSKKPPLGAEYVKDYAQRYVDDHLAPQHLFYNFPHVFDAKGRRRTFMLQGKSRENFIDEFLRLWEEQNPSLPVPYSEVIEEYQDKLAGVEMDAEKTYAEHVEEKNQWPKYQSDFDADLHDDGQVQQFYVEGYFKGWPFIGIESEYDGQLTLTLNTEKGKTWHAADRGKIVQAKRHGMLVYKHVEPYLHEKHGYKFVEWKNEHGLFPLSHR